jgi:hypothetical protein
MIHQRIDIETWDYSCFSCKAPEEHFKWNPAEEELKCFKCGWHATIEYKGKDVLITEVIEA